jgi:hypothetical protein
MKIFVGFLLVFSLASAPALGENRSQVEHLVLISVDGFNPRWYQDVEWPAPFLQAKAREGAFVRQVRPPFPSQTRPGHITMITGWLPAKHGVVHNGSPYRIPEEGSLWHAVRAAGGTTASVVWPGSPHAPIDHRVASHGFPDFSIGTGGAAEPRRNEGQGHSAEYERYITGIFRDAQMMAMGIRMIEEHRATLTTLRFNDTDKMQHIHGRDGAAVRGVVASMDMGLAEVAAAVERAGIADRTVFIVTGDHGMEDIHTLLRPNVLLAEAGLGGRESARFEAYGGSAFLYGASVEEAAEIRTWLESLPNRIREGFRILDRNVLADLGADPEASLALTAKTGFAFDGRWRGLAEEQVREGRHGHLAGPDAPGVFTGFVAWGAGIGPAVILEEIRLEDVAPTAAALLGLDLGERDGRSIAQELARPEE